MSKSDYKKATLIKFQSALQRSWMLKSNIKEKGALSFLQGDGELSKRREKVHNG